VKDRWQKARITVGIPPDGRPVSLAEQAEPGIGAGARPQREAFLLRLWRRPMGLIGSILVAFVLAVAILAPHLAPFDPLHQFSDGITAQGAPVPPGGKFLLGTDDLGRDVLSRLVYGARDSLEFSVTASVLVTLVGIMVGVTAGYYGGWFDQFMMRFTDAMFAFPFLLFLIFLLSILRHTGMNVLITVVTVTSWPGTARLARGETLVAKEKVFIEAERSLGASNRRILVRHVIPNILAPLIVLTTQRIGGFVGLEAALSYLSLGVPPPAPSWGAMVQEGQQYFQSAPWLMIYPGLMLTVTVLGFNLLGDALNAVLNPKRAHG
jgi:peptide/nickel transport system permease protein